MPYVLITAYILLIAPVQIGLLVQWEKGRLSATVGIMAWGIRRRFPFLLSRNTDGRLQLEKPFLPLPQRRKKQNELLTLLPKLLYVRKKLQFAIHLRHFHSEALLSLPSAASTAIACSLLSTLLQLLFPHGRIRIRPAYPANNRGSALCIVDFRLGTLLMAGILWKTHRPSHSKKEEQAWNIPSEN